MEREGASVSALRPTLEARASSYGPEDPSRRAFQPEGPAAKSHTPWTYEHAREPPLSERPFPCPSQREIKRGPRSEVAGVCPTQ